MNEVALGFLRSSRRATRPGKLDLAIDVLGCQVDASAFLHAAGEVEATKERTLAKTVRLKQLRYKIDKKVAREAELQRETVNLVASFNRSGGQTRDFPGAKNAAK